VPFWFKLYLHDLIFYFCKTLNISVWNVVIIKSERFKRCCWAVRNGGIFAKRRRIPQGVWNRIHHLNMLKNCKILCHTNRWWHRNGQKEWNTMAQEFYTFGRQNLKNRASGRANPWTSEIPIHIHTFNVFHSFWLNIFLVFKFTH